MWIVAGDAFGEFVPKGGDVQSGSAAWVNLVEVNFCKSLQELSNVFILQVAKFHPLVGHCQLHCCLDHRHLGENMFHQKATIFIRTMFQIFSLDNKKEEFLVVTLAFFSSMEPMTVTAYTYPFILINCHHHHCIFRYLK